MQISCATSYNKYDKILLAHGSGGKLSDKLIHEIIIKGLGDTYIDSSHDGAILDVPGKLAFTSDSFVVSPLFFPGGDIGHLAVNGTVNDLVSCGATPLYLSLSLILEEGLLISELVRVISSMAEAAKRAGIRIVTGDTKVVEKGKADKIFINTSGIGSLSGKRSISPYRCSEGDAIIITGSIADHGISILSTREGLSFESPVCSDCAPMNEIAELIFSVTEDIHVLRDPTRGGVASALNEISFASGRGIVINESTLPIKEQVKGACEIMGMDPLYLANEGKLLIFLPDKYAASVLNAVRSHPLGREASLIGRVSGGEPAVIMKTLVGSSRIVDMISGEQLPRIC